MLNWLFSDPLPAGTKAPAFSLPDDSGQTVTLDSLRGRNVVLVFYPGDDTPGCTKQLCQFRDDWGEAEARGVEVFGVNPQNARMHQKFRQRYHFPFPLLVDEKQKVAALYHADGLFVKRTVYLIDPKGTIRFAKRGMPHPSEVLAAAVKTGA
ncbi:MAG: peroxiredoxin [Acidobacteriia bacterium]|nr:peroxiredoxin [Terriglobia bacterium]